MKFSLSKKKVSFLFLLNCFLVCLVLTTSLKKNGNNVNEYNKPEPSNTKVVVNLGSIKGRIEKRFERAPLIYGKDVNRKNCVNCKYCNNSNSTDTLPNNTYGIVNFDDPVKDYGNGTWSEGFFSPDIKIGNNSETLVSESNGTFYPSRIENPQKEEDKLGLCFKITGSIGSNLLKILRRIGDSDIWCVQYRYFVSDCNFVNPYKNKFIQASLVTDQDESYTLRIMLPWAKKGWIITDEQATKICSYFNTNVGNNVKAIIETKSHILEESSRYVTNNKLCIELRTNSTDEGLEERIDQLKNETSYIEEQIRIKSSQLSVQQIQYDIKFEAQQRTKKELDSLNSEVTYLSNQYSQILESLNKLKAQGDNTVETRNELEIVIKNSLDIFNKGIQVLKTEAPERGQEIKQAQIENEKLNKDGVKKNIDTIYA